LKKIETTFQFKVNHTTTMPPHVTIDIHTVPLYVPPPQLPVTYIYRPAYVEYPIQVIHPEEMV